MIDIEKLRTNEISKTDLLIKINELVEQINYLTSTLESNRIHMKYINKSPYDLSSHPLKRKR